MKKLCILLAILLLVPGTFGSADEQGETQPLTTQSVEAPPPETAPPATPPPETAPPVTAPPVTAPPVTDPPVTDPPETTPPQTDSPEATAPAETPTAVPTPEPTEEPVSLYKITVEALKRMAVPDYSDPFAWYMAGGAGGRDVDVFFLLPTCWSRRAGQPLICEAFPSRLMQGAAGAYDTSISLFQDMANIYVPYYRQVDSAYAMRQSPEYVEDLLRLASVDDVTAALDYYFDNLNQGRPIILAGHSQGSELLTYVLGVYMEDHPEYYARMVCAYVAGYSVTEDYLARNPHLAFAEGADDTGVIVSWNTEAAGVTGNNPVILPGALVINPVSWTRSGETAAASTSLGARIRGTTVPGFADATVDAARGCLVCTSADPILYSGGRSFPFGAYHSWDYAFYYYDIRENARVRIESYFAEHGGDRT